MTKIKVKFTIRFPTKYLELFYLERSVLLPALAGRTFHQQHCDRVEKFLKNMLQSKNDIVRYIATRAQSNTYAAMGRNFLFLKQVSISSEVTGRWA